MEKRKPERKKNLQSLYLEPDRAELLDSLAADSRIPKAVLLREAVDDLLAKHGLLESEQLQQIVEALTTARKVAVKAEQDVRGSVWLRICKSAIAQIDAVLKVLPRPEIQS